MRLATFNLENLDLPPRAHIPLGVRAEVLRPQLLRLNADILLLQEVNAQHVPGDADRHFAALDQLIAGTPYAAYHRAATTGRKGHGPADVHNLVTLSRYPILATREVRHTLVPPAHYDVQTEIPPVTAPEALTFDRPLLVTDHDLGGGTILSVINLHLRAPLAANIHGQKQAPFVWSSIGGWAEGYFLSAVRRAGQAVELRRVADEIQAQDPHRLIAAAGDFNAEDHETAIKIAVGAEEDTGNSLLTGGSLVVLDRALSADRRWSVRHLGRPLMLDHILASRTLAATLRAIEVHNEVVGDEAVLYGKHIEVPGSCHAGVVAEFALG